MSFMCHGLDCVVNDTGLRTVILWTLIDLYCCVLYDRILERCHTLFCGGDYCGTMAARDLQYLSGTKGYSLAAEAEVF